MYDDYSHVATDKRVEEIKEGVKRLGNTSATGEGIDFTSKGCDCCGTMKAGERHFFYSPEISFRRMVKNVR